MNTFICMSACMSISTGGYAVHDVGNYTSGSSSSSGAVNTKAVASVQTLTLLASVIK